MIKGTQKKIIVVKTSDSAVFEEAYFVLKRDNTACNGDMVKEANRLIGGAESEKKKQGGVKLLVLSSFLCGSGFGALVVALIARFVG